MMGIINSIVKSNIESVNLIRTFVALEDDETLLIFLRFPNFFDLNKNNARTKNSKQTIKYSRLILSKLNFSESIPPNNIMLRTIGPTVVPSELIPPERLSLCEPVFSLPRDITKGFADVC